MTKTIVAKKRINGLDDPGIPPVDNFSRIACVFRKSRSRKRTDRDIRTIPRMRGNMPVPAFRKVPMGMVKERRTVTAPKRKITIPPMISSLFNLSSTIYQIFAKRREHSA